MHNIIMLSNKNCYNLVNTINYIIKCVYVYASLNK